MKALLAIPLILILTSIAILHFYWAFGGKWGFDNALPTKVSGEKLMMPSKLLTFTVGLGLLGMAGFAIAWTMYPTILPFTILYYTGMWILGGIFFIRAIGDFNYVGFFKKIKTTTFAEYDTRYFSPLCLIIALLSFSMAVFFQVFSSGPCF